MSRIHVAIVSRSPDTRAAAVAAFDGAPEHWEVTVHEEIVAADHTVCGPEDAIEGAVVFDPHRPADVLREIERRIPGTASRFFTVSGVGGGSGATTLALHLAAAFGRSCAYLDLDLEWGAAARFGLDRTAIKTWADVGSSTDDVKRAALPVAPGFRALFAPRPGPDLPDPRFVLERCRAIFDPVVVDTGSGAGRIGDDVSACIWVIPATSTGVAKARERIDSFPGQRAALVLSRTGAGGGITKARAADELGRPISLDLPGTPALRDAEDEQRLLVGPWTRYARRVAALARALERA